MSIHHETAGIPTTGLARPEALRNASREALSPPWARVLLDAGVLALALVFAELVWPGRVGPMSAPWLIGFPLFILASLYLRRAYRPRTHLHLLDDIRMVVTTTALAGMAILSVRVLSTDDAGAAGQTVRYWAIATAGLVVMHSLVWLFEIRARRAGDVGELTLVVGAGKVGRLVTERLRRHPELGLRPIGFLDDDPLAENGTQRPLPVLGGMNDLNAVVDTFGVRHVLLTFSTASHHVLLDAIRNCEARGIRVSFVPRLFESMNEKITVESVGSIPLISVEPTNPSGWHFTVKYALDRILAASLIVLLSPFFVTVAFATWIGSGRPILFRQHRVGRDGRPFEMLKFRSMEATPATSPDDLELPPDTAPGGKEGADRTTGVGHFLRSTSLDELPQLFNVVRGEMSLVGPRPERPEFVEIFEQDVHRYADRHRVKSGITGWAQVNGLRGNTSLADRAEWDNYYIDNWSLWLDLKILLSTAAVLVRPRGQ